MNKIKKIKQLDDFFEQHKHLPEQNTKQWLEDRKFFIGGSEMGTIAGTNPFKNIRELIENHLGHTSFTGNINTYWGSVLEDYTVQILEDKWHCKIKETGSLPGAIHEQKYSPDGFVYLEFLDQIILLEIKNAIRRIANGRVPASYKPQIFTGLATAPFADRALFIDSMFRRCALKDFNFTTTHGTIIHPKKPVDIPLLLGAVFMYEDKYSGDYDVLKTKYNKKGHDSFIDGGICDPEDLAQLLSDVKCKKLKRYFPKTINNNGGGNNGEGTGDTVEYRLNLVTNFHAYAKTNDYVPVCILPLKLFKFEIIPVERDDWKKKYNRKTRSYEIQETKFANYVESHAGTIRRVISEIKELDNLPLEKQLERLDELYPAYYTSPGLDEKICEEIIKSMMV